MEYQAQIKLAGDADTYRISPQIKPYTLLDLGFEKSKRGNYKYSGSLDRTNPFQPAARLIITVAGDLSGFKMETVNATGFNKINIFTHARQAEFTLQYHFILDEMVTRGIFEKI